MRTLDAVATRLSTSVASCFLLLICCRRMDRYSVMGFAQLAAETEKAAKELISLLRVRGKRHLPCFSSRRDLPPVDCIVMCILCVSPCRISVCRP